ncbi:hypothetical protein B5807_09126 [Epicoccum nigrum]|uniref:DUF1772-domain-containing protein n=1 Tax=Epicoccum nigrum TaxID=105696 RepID=A0A1Y2LN11_EPING|nr:hypothetical protein B5807_09126 [Epicoccum nigrum]
MSKAVQILTLTTALTTAGGIATLSLFSIPLLLSQPGARSLPQLRWLFSRGSHAAPSGILLSSGGFAYLSYASLRGSAAAPAPGSLLGAALRSVGQGDKPGLFLLASVLALSAAVFTRVMLPTNFELIEMNERLGGARSAREAEFRERIGAAPRAAWESVEGKEGVSQWTDLSGPQERTRREAGPEEEERVRELLGRFKRLNYVRAGLIGVGGVVGLVAALG